MKLVSLGEVRARLSFRGDLASRPKWAARMLSLGLDLADFEGVPMALDGFETENATMLWSMFIRRAPAAAAPPPPPLPHHAPAQRSASSRTPACDGDAVLWFSCRHSGRCLPPAPVLDQPPRHAAGKRCPSAVASAVASNSARGAANGCTLGFALCPNQSVPLGMQGIVVK